MNSIWFCLVGLGHLGELVRTARVEHGQRQRLAARARKVVLDHPPAPRVLRIDPVALIGKLQNDQRRTYFFRRMKLEMGKLLAGRDVDRRVPVPGELGSPLAGPTDNNDDSFRACAEIEVRKLAVRRPSPLGAERNTSLGPSGLVSGSKLFRRTVSPRL